MAAPRAEAEPRAEAPPHRVSTSPPPPPLAVQREPRSGLPRAGAAALLLVGLAVVVAVVLSNWSSSVPNAREESASAGKVLQADDFADPSKGLFLDNQRGIVRQTLTDGTVFEYPWEYGYGRSSLVGLIKGPYPANSQNRSLFAFAPASDKVRGDFAAEVGSRATKSSAQAQYGIQYRLGGNEQWLLTVWPGTGEYQIYGTKEGRSFANGRSAAIKRGNEENRLRMEVRGDTMRVFVNDRELDSAQHPDLAKRGGEIALTWAMSGPAADRDVEVRFTDFKIFDPTQQ